jgi:hypothetical protein
MVVKKILYIEGANEVINGSLRIGFSKLFEKVLYGKMPQIIMGGGKSGVIDKFLYTNKVLNQSRFLLVDLDGPEKNIDKDLVIFNIKDQREVVFFMIQEMEAWFLSQPDVLDAFMANSNM